SLLVGHYLDHIQPVIDEMAAADAHLFVGLDPLALPEAMLACSRGQKECAESAEHDLQRMDAFLRFQRRISAEVDCWCQSQGITDSELDAALAAAVAAEADGRETKGT
ncbi:unnamed protein product, partial [Polarella glacialis]